MAEIGGAALGAVFGELLSAVLKMKDKAIMFKQTFSDLRSTLEAIAPVVKEIEQQNNDLGRPKEELARLIKEMEEGTKLVCRCSKIHRLNYLARVRYQDQLVALLTSLVRFFIIEMHAQTARDQKETLLKVRRILSKVNKLPLVGTDETMGSSSDSDPVPVELTESEIHRSKETRPAENEFGNHSGELVMEHISQETTDSDPVPVDVSESDMLYSAATQPDENAAGTSSPKEVAEPVTSLTQEVDLGQIKAKAENNQATEHLTSEKSYDQLYSAEKRFLGIPLPNIKPILPKIGGFNRQVKKVSFEPAPVYCTECGICIKQNATSYNKGADQKSYPYCNLCHNKRVRRNKITIFEGCSYFELEDLLRASAEVLGKGSYGTTYKATLEDGTILAVKRIKEVVFGKKEFEQQMEIVQRLSQHPNVISLLACYYSMDENLLIYDYIPAGSLSTLLHGKWGAGRTPLDWDSRLKISLGAARGIAHIHSASRSKYVNIKSSNVLVTADFDGCISDFGLAPLCNLFKPSGNEGYLAPEVIETGKWTLKSDVYSFGVLLLEMLTGKTPAKHSPHDDMIGLPNWVQTVIREEWTAEVFDVELVGYQNREEEMVQMLQLAMSCVVMVPDLRPSMEKVVRMIEEIRESSEF